MSELTHYNSIIHEFSDDQLYPKLLIQLKKDFDLTGIHLSINDKTEPQELINIISETIYQLVQYRFDTFMQLLYRIDISEKIMSSNTVDSAETVTQKATFEIIKREWQKVQWREKFSQ